MSASPFWSSPFRYLRWAAHEKPNVFWSLIIGGLGPVTLLVVPPIRKSMGYKRTEAPPLSYPLPDRARESLSGYED